LLESLDSESLIQMGIGSEGSQVKFDVMAFNFGVNEGETFGWEKQKEYNAAAFEKLWKSVDERVLPFINTVVTPEYDDESSKYSDENSISSVSQDGLSLAESKDDESSKYSNNTPQLKIERTAFGQSKDDEKSDNGILAVTQHGSSLAESKAVSRLVSGNNSEQIADDVKFEMIKDLKADIKSLYGTYNNATTYSLRSEKRWWRADQAYNLAAKISYLTELCGWVNACNCASGKDRTGMHVQNALSYAARMHMHAIKMQVNYWDPHNRLDYYKSNHFDILEAVAKEKIFSEVTDFIKLIEQTPKNISADTLALFLGGDKQLNLSGKLATDLDAIHKEFEDDSNYQLTADNKRLLSDIVQFLLTSHGGIIQYIAVFDEAFKEKFPTCDVKSPWELLTDPNISSEDKARIQKQNRDFMLNSGQHEVQEWNTGSPGYKLYSDKRVNIFTGGQTKDYFGLMFGLDRQQVSHYVTMQAKFNAT